MARQDQDLFEGSTLKADLSPMIDLVFLLLIFFMVTANMITYKKDKRVVVPIASDAKVPEIIEGRVVLNVLEDGSVVDTEKRVLSHEDVTQIMSQPKSRNNNARLRGRNGGQWLISIG